MTQKFRLYIDESGTHNYSTSEKVDKRYLALMGVIVSEEEYRKVIQPKIREIKLLFAEDPDELPILHREEIVAKSGCFSKLNDPEFQKVFNEKLENLLEGVEYTLCCVVLDKKTHLVRYGNAAYHPYHYCLNVLLERYTFLLEEKGAVGDVMAEARGRAEDIELRDAYGTFYNEGTSFRKVSSIQSRLTSSSIKIKPKSAGIEGLEFSDLLSLAGKLDVLDTYGEIPPLTDNYCKKIIEKIQPKYRKGPGGVRVKGFGKKLIK